MKNTREKYLEGLNQIEQKNRELLKNLEGTPQEIRAMLEGCVMADNNLGRYQFKSFVAELTGILELNKNWNGAKISFGESYEMIRKIANRTRFGRDLKDFLPTINRAVNQLRVKILQNFLPEVATFSKDEVWNLSIIFSNLSDPDLKQKIAKENLDFALKLIEVVKIKNPRQARNWVDCLENTKLQAKLNQSLDEVCAELVRETWRKEDDLRSAHSFCDAIRDEKLREETRNELPKLYISEAEFLAERRF